MYYRNGAENSQSIYWIVASSVIQDMHFVQLQISHLNIPAST